jgi:hypothetical protein
MLMTCEAAEQDNIRRGGRRKSKIGFVADRCAVACLQRLAVQRHFAVGHLRRLGSRLADITCVLAAVYCTSSGRMTRLSPIESRCSSAPPRTYLRSPQDGRQPQELAKLLECGGKRSATPLWLARAAANHNESAVAAVLCRRIP